MRTEETLEQETPRAPPAVATGANRLRKAERGATQGVEKELLPITSVALVYARRQLVFKEQQRANALYQVVSGAVLLTREVPDRRRHVLDVVGPGSIMGVVPGVHYGCQAQALTRTTLRRIDRSMAEKSAALQRLIALALMQQVEKMRETTRMRTQSSAIERVAALVLSLPAIEGKRGNANSAIDYRVALSQSDMASYLGLAIETVCRIMRDLKRRGAIGMLGRDCIMILDAGALARLAAAGES